MKFPWVKRIGASIAYRFPVVALRLRFAARRPWVTNRAGRRLYVDRGDQRAAQILKRGGAADRDALVSWVKVVETFRPDTIIDIGANYGEILLGAPAYPDGAALHAVEANPLIADLLRRSVSHSGLDVVVHQCAAGAELGSAQLGIDQRSSGLSSLVPGRLPAAVQTKTVPVRRVDSLVPPGRCLLFKLDVEGYEPAVLDGMRELLSAADGWVGLVEVSVDVGTMDALEALGARLYVIGVDWQSDLPSFRPMDEKLRSAFGAGGPPGFSKDVLAVSSGAAGDLRALLEA